MKNIDGNKSNRVSVVDVVNGNASSTSCLDIDLLLKICRLLNLDINLHFKNDASPVVKYVHY